MRTVLRRSVSAAVAALVLGSGLVVSQPVTADAAATKKCSASMSVTKPKQYSQTDVRVSKVASGAKVETIAHYKTTKTKKKATAGSKGTATLPYKISGATVGYKVTVEVKATKGKTTWKCSTSFVPKSK